MDFAERTRKASSPLRAIVLTFTVYTYTDVPKRSILTSIVVLLPADRAAMRSQRFAVDCLLLSQRQALRPLCRHVAPFAQRQQYIVSHTQKISSRLRHVNGARLKGQTRYASTLAADARSVGTRTKNVVLGTGILLVLGFGYLYITDTRAGIHQWLVVPVLRLLHADAEGAHHAALRYLKALYTFGLHPRERTNDDTKLSDIKIEVFGHVLDNPVGISAGLDKNAAVPDALFALGPGLVEVGGITPQPQEGNPKPRVFRVASQNGIINRYGLNSEGADHVAVQLRDRVRQHAYDNGLGLEKDSERQILDGEAGVPPGSLYPGRLLAVQVAKNKTTPDSDIDDVAADYVYCVQQLSKYADILVVNVSSPNTPGLRDLQAVEPLTKILSAVVQEAKKADRKSPPPVMVKVSPDEDSDEQIDGICTAVWASGVDGVIVGNTTKTRPDPLPKGFVLPAHEQKTLTEVGGYSGPQLFNNTVSLIKRYRSKLDSGPPDSESAPGTDFARSSSSSSKVIFASGGITNGQQCLEALNAGASLCQIYTAMMYGGVGTVTRIKSEMRAEMKRSP